MTESPWWTRKEAAAYLRKGARYILTEMNQGRLRAARVGTRRVALTRKEWCDDWVIAQADARPFLRSVKR
jgi:hypothetical protein